MFVQGDEAIYKMFHEYGDEFEQKFLCTLNLTFKEYCEYKDLTTCRLSNPISDFITETEQIQKPPEKIEPRKPRKKVIIEPTSD